MSKHTPGPWIALKNGNVGIFDHSETQSYGMVTHICYVEEYDHPDNHAANANLIAASPDLLAVCQRLLEAVPYVSEYDVPIGLWDDLQAAVNKATGEAK